MLKFFRNNILASACRQSKRHGYIADVTCHKSALDFIRSTQNMKNKGFHPQKDRYYDGQSQIFRGSPDLLGVVHQMFST